MKWVFSAIIYIAEQETIHFPKFHDTFNDTLNFNNILLIIHISIINKHWQFLIINLEANIQTKHLKWAWN
jgi:hypothetical protein